MPRPGGKPDNIDQLEEVQKLLASGHTQDRVREITGVAPRTIRDWKARGYLEAAAELPNFPDLKEIDLAFAIRAPDASITHAWMLALEAAKRAGNPRVHRFFETMMDHNQKVARGFGQRLPIPWLAAVAAFPILTEDFSAPALGEIAHLIHETQPHQGKSARRQYHRQVKPLIRQLGQELATWAVTTLETTPASGMREILARLPDIDRPKGILRRKEPVFWDFLSLLVAAGEIPMQQSKGRQQ